MGYETINVTPVTPRIGAEVDGLTLAKPLSNHQVEELHQALAEHQVLFFRDQPLDVEGHKAFGRYFGDLHIHPNTPGPEGHPEILPIHADADLAPAAPEKKRQGAPAPPRDKRCNNHRRIVGCMLSGARRVHPVIVGWSTRK